MMSAGKDGKDGATGPQGNDGKDGATGVCKAEQFNSWALCNQSIWTLPPMRNALAFHGSGMSDI